MSNVPVVRIGDGIEMPIVGFGTWQLSGQSAYDSVRVALEIGYRHIDTATMYGNEAEVGRAVRDSGLDRGEVFITTKLQPRRAGQERATLTQSLRALGTDYVGPVADSLAAAWRSVGGDVARVPRVAFGATVPCDRSVQLQPGRDR